MEEIQEGWHMQWHLQSWGKEHQKVFETFWLGLQPSVGT